MNKWIPIAMLSAATLLNSCNMEEYNKRQEQLRLIREKERQEQLIAFKQTIDSIYSNDDGFARYEMPFIEITSKKQSYAFDPSEQMENAAKATRINFPVSKKYYDSMREGQTLDEVFNVGGFLGDGELSGYRTYVSDKFFKDMYITIKNDSWNIVDSQTYDSLVAKARNDTAYVQSQDGIFMKINKHVPDGFNSSCSVHIRTTKYNISSDIMKNIFNSMNDMDYTLELPGFLCNQIKTGEYLDRKFVGASLLFSRSPSVVEYYVVSKGE